jgi:hypothetical protein
LTDPTIAQTVLFADLADRPLIATFDQSHASSDGGAILLHAAGTAGVVSLLHRCCRTSGARFRAPDWGSASTPASPPRTSLPTWRRPGSSTEAAYQAGSWHAPRRTILKAEVVWHPGREPRDNPRFVITSLRQTPEWIHTHVYCARGGSENRLKERKLALAFGRTSCTRFWANQLRVMLTAAAFGLFQELQLRADRTALRGAQVPRLRQALITIGVQVVRSVRHRQHG